MSEAVTTHAETTEGPKSALASLRASTDSHAIATISQETDMPLHDVENAASSSEKSQVFERLSQKMEQLGDKFWALLNVFGIGEDEGRARMWKGSEDHDVKEDEPLASDKTSFEWEQQRLAGRNYSWKDWNRAKNIEQKLTAHPEWLQFCQQAADRHGIGPFKNAIVAVIEMESGWNPARRNERSGALGLGQAIFKTQKGYWQERRAYWERAHGVTYGPLNSENSRDPANIAIITNPEIAIDLVAWHAANAIHGINKAHPEFKIDPADPDVVANLYLTHNSGAGGYVAMRRYLDNPTEFNLSRLPDFLRSKDGKFDSSRLNYARRVASVASAYDVIKNNETPKQ